MNFTIVTPAFCVPDQLLSCMESVKNQANAPATGFHGIQHVIQMGGDPAEADLQQLRPYLANRTDYSCELCVEADHGMYDALNKGFARATGTIIGHLNADEQYLPGTLEEVWRLFQAHPHVDAVVGGVVVVDPQGEYICSRFSIVPTLQEVRTLPLSVFTAATFFRKSALDRLGRLYDPSFKASGDADFFEILIRSGFVFHTSRRYFALFEDNGRNLALSPLAAADEKRRRARLSTMEARLSRLTRLRFWCRKLLSGGYRAEKFSYTYIGKDLQAVKKEVYCPTLRWRR